MIKTIQLLALQQLPGVGTQSILKLCKYAQKNFSHPLSTNDLLSSLDACKIKTKIPSGSSKVRISLADLEWALVQAQSILDKSRQLGVGAISYFEKEFPQILKEVKDESGKKEVPPIVLFYKGDINILKLPCIAIVGTRENTLAGEKAGIYLAENFAKRGFCIVSGLALGCDTCAHIGALNVEGKTIAFLGHGLDMVYPAKNKNLAEDILTNGGLLLSEYPVGTSPSHFTLVARDRLQAGLSLATIVIQTGVAGGTMHAANATLNAQKPLFVASYSDQETQGHEKTQGNHLLVQKGAKIISGRDNLDEISHIILNSRKK